MSVPRQQLHMEKDLDEGRHAELRAKTLDNNLTWLKSFGCTVDNQDEIIRIENDELPEYNAYLVLGSSRDVVLELQSILINPKQRDALVYVDEAISTDTIRAVLAASGLKLGLRSRVKTNPLKSKPGLADIELELAQPDDYARWAALYSEGFGRSGQAAEIDLKRWRRAFACPEVLHWFFKRGAKTIGVCQTCISSGVAGVYSFTLSSEERSVNRFVASARALGVELRNRGEEIAYFERIRKRPLGPEAQPGMFRSFKIIRRFAAYERI